MDYGNAFNLTKYLTNETEYIVWDRVSSSIAYVRDMLSSDSVLYPKFQVSVIKNEREVSFTVNYHSNNITYLVFFLQILFREHVRVISRRLGWNDVGTQNERYE